MSEINDIDDPYCVAFADPRCFLPGTMFTHTLGAHVLAIVVGPSPNGPRYCHIPCMHPGGVTEVDHESAQLSQLKAVVVASFVLHESHWQSINAKVASPVICLLASVEGTTVCLEIPLRSPNAPPGDRHLATVSGPMGDHRALQGDISRGV